MGRGTDPDIAACAGLVLDNNRAAQRVAQMLAQNTRHDVGRSGRRKGHDDLDGTFGIAGRLRLLEPKAGGRNRADQEARGPQNLAA